MSKNTTMRRLGDYIRQVDVRNRDLAVTNLKGLSIEKIFIESIANTIGTDLRGYKIVKPRQFAYVPVTSRNGEKITVALYDGKNNCIISQAYTAFEIIDETELLPEYLMQWFRRPEFDRYARFHSHGSARETFDWDEMCNVELPVPPIEEQRKIVARHKAIEHKIDVNRRLIAKLEETARTIYRHTFVENIDPENLPTGWRLGKLSDIADITMGQSPDGDCLNKDKNGIYFYQGSADFGHRFVSPRVYTTEFNRKANEYDILMSVRAPVGDINITRDKCAIGRGVAAMRSKHNAQAYLYYTLHTLKPNLSNDDGTVFGSINKDELFNFEVIVPPVVLIQNFQNCIDNLETQIDRLDKEVTVLNKIGEL